MKLEDWKEKNPYFIESVKVTKLLSKYDITWKLSDTNVLVGKNGSGKSTLLQLLHLALDGPDGKDRSINSVAPKFDSITVTLNNGMATTVSSGSNNNHNQKLKKLLENVISDPEFREKMRKNSEDKNDVDFKTLLEALNVDMNEEGTGKVKRTISGSSNFIDYSKDDNGINLFKQNISMEFISTFDMLLLSKEEYAEFGESTYSQIDIMIKKEVSKLKSLMISLNNETSTEYTTLPYKKDFNTIKSSRFSQLNIFIKEVNKLFNPEDKHFSFTNDGSLLVKTMGKEISVEELSSGEKQLLIILLKVANTGYKHSIIFLDEPEISLHLSWQEKLISSVRRINPKSQLIIVSHSPGLVMDGWMDKAVDMADISDKWTGE
ncbi:ATP-binding protein [Psychromonas arctica]